MRNLAASTLIGLPDTTIRMETSLLFPLLCFYIGVVASRALLREILTVHDTPDRLCGFESSNNSARIQNTLSCKCTNCHFWGGGEHSLHVPWLQPFGRCLLELTSSKCYCFISGHFPHLRFNIAAFLPSPPSSPLAVYPPSACPLLATAPQIPYSPTFPQIQWPRRLLHIISTSL